MTISPDTRDWTFVLRRRCPECLFDSTRLDVDDAAAVVNWLAGRWVGVLAAPDVRRRNRPDRWSPLEYASHVRDVLRMFSSRLERVLREDDPLLQNWDQDATAVQSRYQDADPVVVTRELTVAATAVAVRLESIRPDEIDRPASRTDGATFTVETLIRYHLHDPVHHLHDVTGETFASPDLAGGGK